MVGMMYMDKVSLKETVEELAVMVHGIVESELSMVKVTLVDTEALDGPVSPI